MPLIFYTAGAIAVISTAMVVTRRNAVHALLYLVVSFLALGAMYLAVGAPLAAALQVILYAGAIIVLFVFAVMLIAGGSDEPGGPRGLKGSISPSAFLGPGVLALLLVGELLLALRGVDGIAVSRGVPPVEVGAALFGPYVVATEIAALLLLAGMVGALYLAPDPRDEEAEETRS